MAQSVRLHYHAWLRAADWPRWCALCEDLSGTHGEWLAGAEQAIKGGKVHPSQIRKVEFDPDEYAAWCRTKGRLCNAASRALYATFLGLAGAAEEEPRFD